MSQGLFFGDYYGSIYLTVGTYWDELDEEMPSITWSSGLDLDLTLIFSRGNFMDQSRN